MKRKKKKSAKPVENDHETLGHLIQDVWGLMKQQEKENPALQILHERLDGNLKLLGLTGGIASGKTTVSNYLKEKGVPIIDADELARKVVAPGKPAYKKIVHEFGKEIIQKDKSLNRIKLGQIVFQNPELRKKLETITHPEIFREIAREIKKLRKKNPPVIILDAALLFETALESHVDWVMTIWTDDETQIKRLIKRDGHSPEEALQRIQAQMSIEDKKDKSHFVIDNTGSIEDTFNAVEKVLLELGV